MSALQLPAQSAAHAGPPRPGQSVAGRPVPAQLGAMHRSLDRYARLTQALIASRPRPRPPRPTPVRASPASSSGSLWDSDVVQREFDELMRDFNEVSACRRVGGGEGGGKCGVRAGAEIRRAPGPPALIFCLLPSPSHAQLMSLQRKFPDFDVDGKAIYLDRLDDLADRLGTFLGRIRLADDGVAKAWLRGINGQLLEAGLSVDTLQSGLKAATDTMRGWVAAEAAAGTDPAASAAARAALKARFAAAPDVGALLSDPSVAPALADPRVLAAIKDALAGGPKAVAAYMEDPLIGPVLRKLFEQQQGE